MQTEQSKPLAYSYIRFSTCDQSNGDSLRRQTALRDAWIERNDAVLDTKSSRCRIWACMFQGGNFGKIPIASHWRRFSIRFGMVESREEVFWLLRIWTDFQGEHILPALSLILDLIQHGIRVVQSMPVEMIYDENTNPMNLMMAIMELSRGRSESGTKSVRVGATWRQKKKLAENREFLSRNGLLLG